MKQRECGECGACCVALGDGDRPAHKPCDWLNRRGWGCKHYKRRPQVCQVFRCSWLLGQGRENDRPDKSGVLAHLTVNTLADDVALNIVECWPGAFEQQPKLVEQYKQQKVSAVMLVGFEGQHTLYTQNRKFIDKLIQLNPQLRKLEQPIEAIELVCEKPQAHMLWK